MGNEEIEISDIKKRLATHRDWLRVYVAASLAVAIGGVGIMTSPPPEDSTHPPEAAPPGVPVLVVPVGSPTYHSPTHTLTPIGLEQSPQPLAPYPTRTLFPTIMAGSTETEEPTGTPPWSTEPAPQAPQVPVAPKDPFN